MKKIVSIGVLALLASTGGAYAQDAKQWGVIASFVPTWDAPQTMKTVFGTEDFAASALDVKGSEFRLGVARGRELGGDWSLSFVRKTFKKDSVVTAIETECFFTGGADCVDTAFGTFHNLEAATVTGVEYQSFRPFVTIKNRAQIGLTWGIGVGKTEGVARGLSFDENGTAADVRPAKDIFPNVLGKSLPVTPLGQLELSVAGIVAPGLKIRASGGFNFPGYEVASLSVVYFFGKP